MRKILSSAPLLVVLGLCSTGCVPYVSTYEYIDLQDAPGFELGGFSVPDLDGLQSATKMPSLYRADRGRYRLECRVSPTSYLPAMLIRVFSEDSELAIEQKRQRKAMARGRPCGSFYAVDDRRDLTKFAWVSCNSADPREAFISFDVVDTDGEVVGQEDIPFVLRSNGFYVLPDAL